MSHVKLALKNVRLPWEGWAGFPSQAPASLTLSPWEAVPWQLHTKEWPGRGLQGGGSASQLPELSPAFWALAAPSTFFKPLPVVHGNTCSQRSSEKCFQQGNPPAGSKETEVRSAGRGLTLATLDGGQGRPRLLGLAFPLQAKQVWDVRGERLGRRWGMVPAERSGGRAALGRNSVGENEQNLEKSCLSIDKCPQRGCPGLGGRLMNLPPS